MKLERKFQRTDNALRIATERLQRNITMDFRNAVVRESKDGGVILGAYRNETRKIFDEWGCNSTCVANHTTKFDFNPDYVVHMCQCPRGIKVAHTNTPFAKVRVQDIEEQPTELSGT